MLKPAGQSHGKSLKINVYLNGLQDEEYPVESTIIFQKETYTDDRKKHFSLGAEDRTVQEDKREGKDNLD